MAGKGKFEGAPLLLGLVLGPRMEMAFRQSLMISHGDFRIFTDRPISLAFLLTTAIFLIIPILRLGLKRLGKGGSSKGSEPAS